MPTSRLVPDSSSPVPKSISTRRPPLSRMTFWALMSRCSRPGAVHRRQRRAEVQADERRFARAERSARLDGLLERLAAHELHPQADAAVVLLGAVDLDDVRVAHARQAARFLQQPSVGFRHDRLRRAAA